MKKFITSILILSAILLIFSSSLFGDNAVKLLTARSGTGSYNGPYQDAYFEILVDKLAYDKVVSIRIEGADGEWFDIPASYAGPAEGNFELWTARYSSGYGGLMDLQFSVKYVAAGKTYFDNNGGQNYFLGQNDGIFLAKDLNVKNAGYVPDEVKIYNGAAYFTFDVAIRNLDLHKNVKVKYSTDSWATWSEISLKYVSKWSFVRGYVASPNSHGVEMWTLSSRIELGENVESFSYAISYTVNKTTYWDNNFGRNYHITINHY